MDIAKTIVKARPGVLGGRHEEKRPLRERAALSLSPSQKISRPALSPLACTL